MAESRDARGAAADPAAEFHARLEELRREGAYDRWQGGRVPWDEATATARLDGILWAALGTSPAGGPMTPGADILAAVGREIDPDRLSPPQREMLRDVRADFDAGRLDGQDRASRMDRAYDALSWVAGIEHFDRWLERYKQDGLYNRPANTPWGEVPEADKVHAIVGLAHRERPPGDYALAVIEREVDYGRLPPERREALQVLRARIDAGELDGHQHRDLADRANYALRLAEFEMRIEDYKRDGDPWQEGPPRPWAALPEVRKLDLIVQEVGGLHLHFEPREYEIIDREVDLARVPEGRRRGIESNRERLRIGPEEYERRRQEKYAPPNEAAAAFKERIEEGLWTTCFTDGAKIFADWSDLTAEAKLHELARAMDWDRVPESYFRTMVERELKVEDLPAEKRTALENPRQNRHVFAAGFEDGIDAPPHGRDVAAADDRREARYRELFDTANRVQFAEFLREKALDPEVALAPAGRVREAYMRAAEATWDSFRDELEFRSDAEIQETLDLFRAKEAQLGEPEPKTLMDLLQAGGFFGPAGVALAGQDDGAPALRDTTRNLVEAILLDVWPRNAAVVDFGIDTDRHLGALQFAIREELVTPQELDAAMGNGPKLTEIARRGQNPYRDVTFKTSWDDMPIEPDDAPPPTDAAVQTDTPPPSLTAAILDNPRSFLPDSGPGDDHDHGPEHGNGTGRKM